MAKPKKLRNRRVDRRGVRTGNWCDSWCTILLQVPGQAGIVELDAVIERLVGSGVIGEVRRDIAMDLHQGRIPVPAGRWGLLVSLPGQPWAYLLPNPDEYGRPGFFAFRSPAEIAGPTGLRIVMAGHQDTAGATFFCCHEGAEILVEFESCGMGGEVVEEYSGFDEMFGQTKFRSTRLPRDWIGRFEQERAVQDALAKEFDAYIPIIYTYFDGEVIGICGLERKEFEPGDYLRIDLLGFGSARLETSPAAGQLRDALRAGDAEAIRSAVAAGADLRAVPGMESPPLQYALEVNPRAKSSRRELVETLLDLGADPNAPGHEPAIHLVVGGYTLDEGEAIHLLELLIAHGADVNRKGSAMLSLGRTPLHIAALKGQSAIVRYLLSREADPGAVDANGHTPRRALEAIGRRKNPFATEESDARNAAMIALLAEAEAGRADLDWRAEAEASSRRELRRRRERKVALGRIGEAFKAMAEVSKADASAQSITKVMTLTQPDEIHLKPTRAKWPTEGARAEAAAILESEGFRRVGRFAIPEMPRIRLEAYYHPRERLYAVIYDAAGESGVDLVRYGLDGSSLTVTSNQTPPESHFDMPGRRKIRLPGSPISDLLAAAHAEPEPEAGIAAVTADEFVERFERAYRLEIQARKRRLRRD
jgi:hypothetical protein